MNAPGVEPGRAALRRDGESNTGAATRPGTRG